MKRRLHDNARALRRFGRCSDYRQLCRCATGNPSYWLGTIFRPYSDSGPAMTRATVTLNHGEPKLQLTSSKQIIRFSFFFTLQPARCTRRRFADCSRAYNALAVATAALCMKRFSKWPQQRMCTEKKRETERERERKRERKRQRDRDRETERQSQETERQRDRETERETERERERKREREKERKREREKEKREKEMEREKTFPAKQWALRLPKEVRCKRSTELRKRHGRVHARQAEAGIASTGNGITTSARTYKNFWAEKDRNPVAGTVRLPWQLD